MLTVREALEMPLFSSSQVVAGRVGLDGQIEWVHTVDIPDASYEWRRRGVLLLTAGFGLQDNPERQAALIPKLVEEGFAGMVLSTGYYFEHTPAIIRQTADELDFPVIEAPSDLLFIEISEAILEQIINRQYALLQQSTQIHKQLTELVLQGEDLNGLASVLAELLQRAITIEDSSFRVLADAQIGPIDKARQRSIINERTTPEVAQRLLDAGIYDQLLQQMGPLRVPPMPDMGMSMERFVAPIIVDREIYGYIWVIAGDHPLTDLDELALGHAATVAALILFKERAVREAEEALRGDFLEQLLRGTADSAVFSEQAHRLDYRQDRPHQVLLLSGSSRAGGNARSLLDDVQNWLQAQDIQPLQERHPLLVWRDEYLVLLIESENVGTGKQVAKSLFADLSHPARRLLIGVGDPSAPLTDESGGVRRSYEEAQEAVRVGKAMDRNEGIMVFEELGVLHWLYHLPPEKRADNAYLHYIHMLAAYDAERDAELVKSLETYLDHGRSLVEAAEALYIHRNTLLHRLERIQKLCRVDLRDPRQCLNLHVAVKGYRLHQA
jgi:purine catabolism regulator